MFILHKEKFFRALGIVFMLSLLSACATDSVLPESPEITVKGVDILELGLDRQRFQFNLNAYNPNKFGLPLNGVSFNL